MTDQSGTTPTNPGADPHVPQPGASAYTPPSTAGGQPQAYGTAGSYQPQPQPQPYGATGSSQPPAPYNAQPQPPYGTHNPYATPAGYGAPAQPMPPAQGAYGYAPAPVGYGQPAARSGVLGWIGLLMVTLAGVTITVMGYLMGGIAGKVVELQQSLGTTTMDTNDPRVQQIVTDNPWMMLSTPAFLVGLAGFVISIVAFATRRGRKPGLWGILLGIAFPILSVVVMVMVMMPYLQS